MNWDPVQHNTWAFLTWALALALIVAFGYLAITRIKMNRGTQRPVEILFRPYHRGRMAKKEFLRLKKNLHR